MNKIIKALAKELNIGEKQVIATVGLLDEGNTVPFIARYRKEMTGGLTDEQLRTLDQRLIYLRNLQTRKAEVKKLLEEMEQLTPEIKQNLDNAVTLQEIEDIYRPFRPKRRTRATIAREKGLEPFAKQILAQQEPIDNTTAETFVNPEKGVTTPADAIAGALDIIAEIISDDAKIRKSIRNIAYKKGVIEVSGLTDEVSTYSILP